MLTSSPSWCWPSPEAFGTLAANSLSAFLVESSVAHAIASGSAGLLLALGSAVGVGSRIYAGLAADRRLGGHLQAVVVHLLGGVGLSVLATGGSARVIILTTVLAFGGAWGWNGIFTLAIVDTNRNAPAAATGITQAGLYLGGVVGPAVFGRLVETTDYTVARLTTATMVLLSAGGIFVGHRLLQRARRVGDPVGGPSGP
jgi:predicted MFS family arabinose efflux permease